MAGTIKHEWNGTTLTITSDSGTSSMDLKGATGDMGIRGPQGPCGVIYSEDGVTLAENLATTDYVDKKFENINLDVDLDDYATKAFVTQKVVEVTTGGAVSLDGYATEHYVNKMGTEVIDTIYNQVNLSLAHNDPIVLNRSLKIGSTYDFTFVWNDGITDKVRYTLLTVMEDSDYQLYYKDSGDFSVPSGRVYILVVHFDKPEISCFWEQTLTTEANAITQVTIQEIKEAKQFLPQAIPVDNETIKTNIEGKLYCTNQGADLTGYATEAYVTEKIAEVVTNGTVSLDGYATEEYVNNAVSNINLSNYYTKGEINAAGYQTAADVKAAIQQSGTGTGADLSNYYTKTEINNAGYQTAEQVQAAIEQAEVNVDLSNYYTKQEIDDKIDAIEVTGGTGNGKDGEDGKTPYIQDGYWWIGETNTGVKAEGKDGEDYVLTADDKAEIASYVSASAAPTHVWGTASITAGSASTEPTGTLHLVIE